MTQKTMMSKKLPKVQAKIDDQSIIDRVFELRTNGFTQMQIGNKLGMSQGTVSRVLITRKPTDGAQ